METLHPKSNRVICVIALLALNLGVLMLIAQTRLPLDDDTVLSSAGRMKLKYREKGRPGYRFPSCSAESVFCHRKGNLAGL